MGLTKEQRELHRQIRLAAQTRGDIVYYTGVACCRGHLSDRDATTGQCVECSTDKYARSRPDGLRRVSVKREFRRWCVAVGIPPTGLNWFQWVRDNADVIKKIKSTKRKPYYPNLVRW